MADQGSDLTIKQMLSGFSAMQYNLGLLPMQTSQPMAGAPMQVAPPPPPSMHPAQAAAQVMAEQQAMMQQTLQAAQMTRYIPPPSAPMPSVGAISAFSAMGNPFAASGAPPSGGQPAAPFVPRIEAPGIMASMGLGFGPSMPYPRFTPPVMRSAQMTNAYMAEELGSTAGLMRGAMGIGGSAVGAAIGQALIPIPGVGALAGGLLGGMVGGGISNLMIDPVIGDMRRARAIQSSTAGYMRTGAMLDPTTGMGMSGRAAREVSRGIREFQYDTGMEGLGFNTADYTRITQLSAEQGLLIGANSPDQMLQKVKDLSKNIKTLMQISGDPDIRNAIKSLGEMRDLGYLGLNMQARTVALRAASARIAGMSQQDMDALAMSTAGMASRFGLAGATGYSAGLTGAAMGAVSISSGALNELQLARAGGRTGLAALNAQTQMSALNNEAYLLAGSRINAQGQLVADADAYRKALTKPMDQVVKEAADRMREMGTRGITDWATRKQEIKDELSQRLTSTDRDLMAYQQARAHQAMMGGESKFSLAASIAATQGISMEDARTQALQYSPENMRAKAQQLGAQMSWAREADLAALGPRHTPGVLTRLERSFRRGVGDISDRLTGFFRNQVEQQARFERDEEAAARGERISRYSTLDIVGSEQERAGIRRILSSRGARARIDAGSQEEEDEDTQVSDFLKRGLRVGTLSRTARLRGALSEVYGFRPGQFGADVFMAIRSKEELTRLGKSVESFAEAYYARKYQKPEESAKESLDVARALGGAGGAAQGFSIQEEISTKLLEKAQSGDALAMDTTKEVIRSVLKKRRGLTGKELEDAVNKAAPLVAAEHAKNIEAYGSEEQKASLANTLAGAAKTGAVKSRGNAKKLREDAKELFKRAGIVREGTAAAMRDFLGAGLGPRGVGYEGTLEVSDKVLTTMKGEYKEYLDKDGKITDWGADVMAYAAAKRTLSDDASTDEAKAKSQAVIDQLLKKYEGDDEKISKLKSEGNQKAKTLSKDSARVWGEVSGTSKTAAEAAQKVKDVVEGVAMRVAATVSEKAGDVLGTVGGLKVKEQKTTGEKLRALTEEQINKSGLSETQKRVLLDIKKKGTYTDEEVGAAEAALGEVTQLEETQGATAMGASQRRLQEQMAQYESAAAQMTPAQQRQAQTNIEASSALTLGEAVGNFAKAVDKFVGATAEGNHAVDNPLVQAVTGGLFKVR